MEALNPMTRAVTSKTGLPIRLGLASLIFVIGLGPAVAQIPPDEDEGTPDANHAPRHHARGDTASQDPQPYYVDGVEYKPYVPEKAQNKSRSDKPEKTVQPDVGDPNSGPLVPGYVPPYQPPAPVQPRPKAAPDRAASTDTQDDQDSSASDTSASAPQPPMKRPRYAVAIIRALDKVTAESVMFEAPVGQPRRYKGLIYLVKACETNAPDEARPDVMAYLEVTAMATGRTDAASAAHQIFRGWTFATTPGLNAMQNPAYDAWVVSCKNPIS